MLNQKKVLKIGITSGDPAGIGPEIIAKALNDLPDTSFVPVVIGSADFYRHYHNKFFRRFTLLSLHDKTDTPTDEFFVDVPLESPMPEPGKGTPATGRESLRYIDAGLDLWEQGAIDALVTGPVSKGLIERSGTHFTGHTEYLAARTGGDPFMMMFSEDYRVILATTHLPLSQVSSSVNRERILQVITAGNESIKAIDGAPVRLAVAGLDPHCGDDGAIGTFDRDVTAKAIEDARRAGIDVEGPFAADTLFMADRWKEHNLVIAQYHDQGLIPFKLLAFDRGVNVTLGLPLVRTSVDHGTAFNIAGKDRAGYSSMIEAIAVACRLVQGRRTAGL